MSAPTLDGEWGYTVTRLSAAGSATCHSCLRAAVARVRYFSRDHEDTRLLCVEHAPKSDATYRSVSQGSDQQ